MYIERTQQAFLKSWFRTKPRKPLIVRGARQVGKSTLVRRFAEVEGLTLAEVNLEEHRTFVRPAFESGSAADVLAVCARVSGVNLADTENAVLFLDEIQAVPAALQSLRYLYEKHPRLAVVAAGSVLEFTLGAATFSMPVGRVTYLFLPPVTFKEYLMAGGNADLVGVIESVDPRRPESLRLETHGAIMRLLRESLLVGGMPEAIATYLDRDGKGSGAAPDVSYRSVHNDILNSYRDDIQKYRATSHIREVLREVFDRVPAYIGRKVKYAQLAPGEPSRDVKRALGLLVDAGLLHEAIHTDARGAPLAAEEDRETRKLYYLDAGLLLSKQGLSAPENIPLDETRLVNEGILAEQFVAQELLARAPARERSRLHYWLRERKALNAEVDFVLPHGRHVLPLEVKAGPAGQMKSLWEFCKARQPALAVRFDAGLPSLKEYAVPVERKPFSVALLTAPLYLASELDRLVKNL